MATRWARVVRGLVASLVAVFVAAFAHVVGGGSVPGLLGIALVLAFCVPASILLAGRTVSIARLTIAVGLSQGAFHVLFWLTGDAAGGIAHDSVTGMHGMAGMSAMPGPEPASGLASFGTPFASAAPFDALLVTNGWMSAAHSAAALVTVLALRYGESAFWTLVAAARLTFIRLTPIVVPVTVSIRRAPVDFLVRIDRRQAPFLGSGLRHRGPPALAFASAV